MDTYGAILKKRIKEAGYTQQEFADSVPMSLSALKKYMSGKSKYTVDLLERFAKLLDCSYDYLMGVTLSARRDIQDIKDATRLSDDAIDKIRRIVKKLSSKNEKEKEGAQAMIASLDMVIKSEAFENISFYMMPDCAIGQMEEAYKSILFATTGDADMPFKLENALAMSVIQELDRCRYEIKRENEKHNL